MSMYQVGGSSAGTQQDPKEAVPPWLAGQKPDLTELFGASSSDEERAPEQAARPAAGRAGEAKPSQACFGTDNLQATKRTPAAEGAEEAKQTDLSAADDGLKIRTLRPEVPNPVPDGKGGGSAQRLANAAAKTPGQRINYSAVAEQLKSCKDAPHAGGSSGCNTPRGGRGNSQPKLRAGSSTEQPPAVSLHSATEGGIASQNLSSMQGRGITPGSKRRDPWAPVLLDDDDADEGGDTPRFGTARTGPWEPMNSDKDASRVTPGSSSADSDAPQPKRTAAQGRGADRRQNGASRNTAQTKASAGLEPKKSSIPESLKQALAAQVWPTKLPHGL